MTPLHLLRLILFAGFFCGFVFLRNPSAQVSTTTVMSGLDNPRGLTIDPNGVLYVAEGGKGGAGPCRSARGQSVCFGASGAVSRLRDGRQERFISGLPSAITPTGEVTGPHDVAVTRNAVYVLLGLGGDPAEVEAAYGSNARYFGKLLVFLMNGLMIPVDVSGYEARRTEARRPIDSNPYGLTIDGQEALITDAGANAVFRIGSRELTTYAVFPSAPQRPFDSVPTAVVRGPDGARYVGELTGVPFAQGAARIYRVTGSGEPQVFLEGFKTIIDLAFGPDGSLYVLEHASGPVFFAGPGQITRIAQNGARTIVLQGLDRPTSIAVDRDGRMFVTNHGISAGTGEVLRIN